MRTARLQKSVACAAIVAATVISMGGVASAHIHPDPLAMQASTSGTVGFAIEHGCNGSPTTSVTFQIPKEITDIAAVDKAGWTATKTADTIEFSGGSLPADQEDHFDLRITAPSTAGDVRFPIIQTCQQGELAWIEVAAEGQPEPEHPAPTLKITSGPPTSADLTPEPEGTDASGAPDGTAVILSAPTTTTAEPSGSGNTGAVVGVAIAAVVVLGAGGWLLARRRRAD